ncbi:hypothetical protein N0V90_001791 [Kalmusia sp. IMI 367209]|nr:hypothetical protein N0V90_001791 [Kalmusia sp. IMI 367209]
MPLCTIHLIALHSTAPQHLQTFLSTLDDANISPLVASRVIRWIILPSALSTEHLLARNIRWDILLILLGTNTLPSAFVPLIQHHWDITAGVPSRLVQDFAAKNKTLLHPEPNSVPKHSGALDNTHTTASAQDLELSGELRDWVGKFYHGGGAEGRGAVSMFNLLSFKPGMKESYLEYGKAFASHVGKSHGGNAKIVGGVTAVNGVDRGKGTGDGEGWDEVALAHYPSILHFAEMLANTDYQDANKRYRVPALRDTAILMTSEIEVEDMMMSGMGGNGDVKGKL